VDPVRPAEGAVSKGMTPFPLMARPPCFRVNGPGADKCLIVNCLLQGASMSCQHGDIIN